MAAKKSRWSPLVEAARDLSTPPPIVTKLKPGEYEALVERMVADAPVPPRDPC